MGVPDSQAYDSRHTAGTGNGSSRRRPPNYGEGRSTGGPRAKAEDGTTLRKGAKTQGKSLQDGELERSSRQGMVVSPEGIEPSTNRLRVAGRAIARRRRS